MFVIGLTQWITEDMSTRSRQISIQQKRRQRLATAKQLARVNPDALARNLLRLRTHLRGRQQRRELWHLLQNLGSDAVIRRASQTIKTTRSYEELEAVLRAASNDLWFETAPAILKRFHREVERIGKTKVPDRTSCLHAIAIAAARLGCPLSSADVRVLLHHRSARFRAVGAEIVALQQRGELLNDLLPLCWDRGDAAVFAGEMIGKFGDEEHAAALWPKILAARSAGRLNLFRRLLAVMGAMGAFDIQIALRVWIEEDLAEPGACLWNYGKLWSQLVAAKFSAQACSRDEALDELRWFLRIAGAQLYPPPQPGEPNKIQNARNEDYLFARQGLFFIARQFVMLGAQAEAEALLASFAKHGLPPPEQFPELRFPSLKQFANNESRGELTAWLASTGDKEAQAELMKNWMVALREARLPEHWELRGFCDPTAVLGVLRQSLQTESAGCLREILGLLIGDPAALGLRHELNALAAKHPSAIVRWKAKRVLKFVKASARGEQKFKKGVRPSAPHKQDPAAQRGLRLDAAVLAGARRPAAKPRAPETRVRPRAKPPAKILGLLPPAWAGRGYRLQVDGLGTNARGLVIKALLKAPLAHALDRQLPCGPGLEQRPDIKAVTQPAPPGNEIDQRMIEMASAVMTHWADGEEILTLDEEGVGQVAAGLSAEIHILEEEDITACGAFVGEALRKRLGGHWSGFDDRYTLEIRDQIFDPIAWVHEVYARKDMMEGATMLAERFQAAISELEIPAGTQKFHADPSTAFQATMTTLYAMPVQAPMAELLSEARVLSFRLLASEWPMVLAALEPLIEPGSGVRAVAAVCAYAPGEIFGRAWAHWGREMRESSGLVDAVVEAMQAVAEMDDINALPNWTIQPQQGNFSFLNPLRKRMLPRAWRKVLLLLMRQRALAGDRSGTGWCLYSYKYEFPDSLTLLKLFCDMSVSARQTMIRATMHSTRDEQKLFRPLWAEGLRDPATPVVRAALESINQNCARSLRPLVEELIRDKRADVAEDAGRLLKIWQG